MKLLLLCRCGASTRIKAAWASAPELVRCKKCDGDLLEPPADAADSRPVRSKVAAGASQAAGPGPAPTEEDSGAIPLDNEDDGAVAVAPAGRPAPQATCPGCKAALPPGAILCVSCGLDLRTGRKVKPGSGPKRTPGAASSLGSSVRKPVALDGLEVRTATFRPSIVFLGLLLGVLALVALGSLLPPADDPKREQKSSGNPILALLALGAISVPFVALFGQRDRFSIGGGLGDQSASVAFRVAGLPLGSHPVDVSEAVSIRRIPFERGFSVWRALIILPLLGLILAGLLAMTVAFPPFIAIGVILFLFRPLDLFLNIFHESSHQVTFARKFQDSIPVCQGLTKPEADVLAHALESYTGLRGPSSRS